MNTGDKKYYTPEIEEFHIGFELISILKDSGKNKNVCFSFRLINYDGDVYNIYFTTIDSHTMITKHLIDDDGRISVSEVFDGFVNDFSDLETYLISNDIIKKQY